MIHVNCKQRSAEWFECRRGVATASNFNRIMTSKLAYSKQSFDYAIELVNERFGIKEERFVSDAMLHGIEFEDEAAISYTIDSGRQTTEAGFCFYDERRRFGVSPDRFVGGEGLLEIKCPQAKTILKYHHDKELPTSYVQQVHGQLAITGRAWCDFYAYHPDPQLQPFFIRVEKDDAKNKKILSNLEKFADECDKLEKLLKEKTNG
jgi:putative phage-type endonuclease